MIGDVRKTTGLGIPDDPLWRAVRGLRGGSVPRLVAARFLGRSINRTYYGSHLGSVSMSSVEPDRSRLGRCSSQFGRCSRCEFG